MPGWHEATRQWRAEKKLQIIGVIQEQHPERCRLFAQWKQFDWPILHDPINRLGLRAVPIVTAIDEHGVVRSTRPSPQWVKNEFIDREFDEPQDLPKPKAPSALSDRQRGDEAILWRQSPTVAINAYAKALATNPQDAAAHFRTGVAYRMRSESAEQRRPGDFRRAVDAWSAALELDPNHYIYRRRIQQYGPRLAKPYPFYDWVEQARAEIRQRGETPVALPVEPSGAEIASPAKFTIDTPAAERPDPQNRIDRDTGLVDIEAVAAPAAVKPGDAVRIHVELRPTAAAHWNNEVEPLLLWIEKSEGLQVSRRRLTADSPTTAESRETRRLELEAQLAKSFSGDRLIVRGFALYYVCEEEGGTCLYRRQDFEVPIRVK